jgi:predicted MFS family arabinose efflux permease
VAVVGSVLSTRYQHTLEPALAARHVPHVAAQAILGSLGGALAVARIAGGSLGVALAQLAREGFMLGSRSAFIVSAGVTGVGVVVVVAALPSRPPAEEPDPSPPPADGSVPVPEEASRGELPGRTDQG